MDEKVSQNFSVSNSKYTSCLTTVYVQFVKKLKQILLLKGNFYIYSMVTLKIKKRLYNNNNAL